MRWLFCLLGLLLIVEGLPYFACPDRVKKWMSTIQKIPDGQLRVLGLISMSLGLLLAYLFNE